MQPWVALLLLVVATEVQARARHDSPLGRSGFNLDQLPWGKEGLRHEVSEKDVGVSGSTVVLPPTRPDERAADLKPHTVWHRLRPGTRVRSLLR